MHSITIGRISISLLESSGPVRGQATLWHRLLLWRRLQRTSQEMAEADPRILADAGAPPRATDPGLAAFRLDPAPLWSAGLTPQPVDPARR